MDTRLEIAADDTASATAPAAVKPSRWGWLREAAIVVGFYYVYETIRSLADHGGVKNRAYANARRLVDLEKSIHIFHEQAVQQVFIGATWFIKLMNIYYGSLHFVITAGLLIWLYMKRHESYRHMRNLLGLTTMLAVVGYWAFPLAPPRLYKCNNNIPVPGPGGYTIGKCFVDTLDKVGGLWSYHSPVAKAVANQYAAMPSLHFAWALWCACAVYPLVRNRAGRTVVVAFPVVTLLAIVVTANHFWLDAAGGAAVLGAGHLVSRGVELAWAGRHRARVPAPRHEPAPARTVATAIATRDGRPTI